MAGHEMSAYTGNFIKNVEEFDNKYVLVYLILPNRWHTGDKVLQD